MQVAADGCFLQYPRHEAYDGCPAYQDAIIASLQSSYSGATTEVLSPHKMHLLGPATSKLQLESYGRSIG